MEKTINQIGPAEYELEIKATAAELAPDIDKAVRLQRGRTQMKGFRPGKVPAQLVKKMYGRALAYGIVEDAIQKVYEEIRDESGYDVLGAPRMTELDYDLDKDLRAIVRFGVRPDIELKDLSEVKVTKLVHEVTDEEVEEELERLRRREAELIPLEEPVGEEDFVVVDIQRLDDATGTPVIGQKEEDVSFFLDDPRLKEELRAAILNKKAGDSFKVEMGHDVDHEHEEPQSELLELPTPEGEHAGHAHSHSYQVTVKEAKRRDMPELDEEFVKTVTKGKVEDEAGLRAEVRQELVSSWTRNAREFLDQNIVERMLELHPVPVPSSLVEVYLDSFVEDIKQRNNGNVPEGFHEESFREANRAEAEKQARWMLLRDKVVEEESVEVSEDDLDQHLAEMSGSDEISPDMMRQFYRSMPGLLDRLRQRLLGEKVFKALEARFQIEEKNREELEKEIEERNATATAAAGQPNLVL